MKTPGVGARARAVSRQELKRLGGKLAARHARHREKIELHEDAGSVTRWVVATTLLAIALLAIVAAV